MTFLRFIVITAGIALGATGLYFGYAPQELPTAPAHPKQKGVCWVGSRQQVTQAHLLSLRDNGVTWISQTPFGWQRDAMVPDIRFQTGSDRIMWGESFEGLAATTIAASSLGIHTMLKPHLWVHDTWAGAVEMQNEEDWKKWFESYERFILTYARFADSLHIEVLCIGTELEKTSRRAEWIPLIAKIRQHYHGKITYAANFSEFEHVTFWPYLDYIGIQGYFPLTDERKPSLEELMDGWRKPIARVEKSKGNIRKR
ncbi:MAG: hypothetical protein HC859_11210 [Bacteroidia bacterium]|nr:hypothetical protein [Bacteroidia bacterium]